MAAAVDVAAGDQVRPSDDDDRDPLASLAITVSTYSTKLLMTFMRWSAPAPAIALP
jgi:hypothetical protein